MKKLKVLTLSLFPLSNPDFGGKVRFANFVKTYKEFGFDVESIGVLGSSVYPSENGYLAFPDNDLKMVIQIPYLMEDWAIGELVVKNRQYFNRLINCIKTEPDFVHVESPWLFKFAEEYVRLCDKRPKIIYSSQNIEAPLRYQILSRYFSENYAKDKADLIEATEKTAARKSDLIFAVTESDKQQLEKWSSSTVILAPNGVRSYIDEEIDWREFKKLNLPKKYAVFCASGYDPNYYGFISLFKKGFGALDPDQKLIITGSICDRFSNEKDFSDILHMKASSILLGTVTENLLGAILAKAHACIVPILEGGGSNIKTAQAIAQGCYVLGTDISFRGFEQYLSCKGIFVASSGGDFLRKLRFIMQQPPLELSESEKKLRQKLLWKNCLSEAINTAKNILD